MSNSSRPRATETGVIRILGPYPPPHISDPGAILGPNASTKWSYCYQVWAPDGRQLVGGSFSIPKGVTEGQGRDDVIAWAKIQAVKAGVPDAVVVEEGPR